MNSSILLAGSGPLATAIERRLKTAGAAVERIRQGGNDEFIAPECLDRADVLVLAADDDAGNVDLALQTRRMRASLPLVVRLFDSTLVAYLRETMPAVTLLSMSAIAAPVFAEATRKVLAARGEVVVSQSARAGQPHPSRRFHADRILVAALLSLLALVFPSALFFSYTLDLRYFDALYFVWTTVMTVGYGDIALKEAPAAVKLYGMALMLAGAGFIAVLFALLSDWVLNRRLELLRGRRRVNGRGHVLIVGAGNIGFRTAEMLSGDQRRLVIIERNADNRNVSVLRSAGHHVIIADAADAEILELAGLRMAAVVLATTDIDAVNLQVALRARACGIPVIVRMVSPELSTHISERGDGMAFSPVSAAAERFAEAALTVAGSSSA